MRIAALLLFASLFALSPALAPFAEAQALPGIQELSITLSPQYPKPYETVTATIGSTLLDLATGSITISVNGKAVAEGSRSATFTAGAAGAKTTVVATVKDAEGTHAAQAVIYPEDVALVVEPSSSVPPFYKGAKLPASEGNVRIVALASFVNAVGATIAPQNLAYTWKFGDRVLEANSGLGKNVLQAQAPVRYRDARITVTVTTQDKSLAAQSSALVSPVDPFVRIYRTDPLSGIDFSSALSGTFALTSDEETFRAVPFFFAGAPSITWSLNGSDSGSDPDLTVRTTGSSAGTALLSARAGAAESRLTLQFGQARSTGIFGL